MQSTTFSFVEIKGTYTQFVEMPSGCLKLESFPSSPTTLLVQRGLERSATPILIRLAAPIDFTSSSHCTGGLEDGFHVQIVLKNDSVKKLKPTELYEKLKPWPITANQAAVALGLLGVSVLAWHYRSPLKAWSSSARAKLTLNWTTAARPVGK